MSGIIGRTSEKKMPPRPQAQGKRCQDGKDVNMGWTRHKGRAAKSTPGHASARLSQYVAFSMAHVGLQLAALLQQTPAVNRFREWSIPWHDARAVRNFRKVEPMSMVSPRGKKEKGNRQRKRRRKKRNQKEIHDETSDRTPRVEALMLFDGIIDDYHHRGTALVPDSVRLGHESLSHYQSFFATSFETTDALTGSDALHVDDRDGDEPSRPIRSWVGTGPSCWLQAFMIMIAGRG